VIEDGAARGDGAEAEDTPGIRFRQPREADYPAIGSVIDEWWGGRKLHLLLPRLWLQHFTGTSWLAEAEDGTLAGFLIGFLSPERPAEAYCHMVATNPNLRQRGIGRGLYERFFADARAAGRSRVTAVTWPGNRLSIAFHRAMGFEVQAGPGTQNLYGTPACPGYDLEDEDRAVLVRTL
jgi:ribosomal protein S18 acetylase RimI-like enzyme